VAQVIDLGLEHHFRSGALINLFPDWSDERFPLYVYYASRNHVPAKVRKFIDFIVESHGKETGSAARGKSVAKREAIGSLATAESD
jgi:DNA-binding transcriptional LysR family regulator